MMEYSYGKCLLYLIIVVSEICLSYYNCVEIVYWFEIEEL